MKESSRALRVARLSRAFPPRTDGWARHVLRLSEEQCRQGGRVVVVQPEVANGRIGDLEVLRAGGRSANTLGTPGVVAFSMASLPVLVRAVRSVDADVVHVHGDALEIAAGLVVGRIRHRAVVATVHSVPSRRPHWRWLLRGLAPSVAGFVAVSTAVRDELIGLGVANDRILVQSSGVDLVEYDHSPAKEDVRRELGFEEEDFIVVFVGRLEPVKGLHTLADASKRCALRTRILVVGDGSLAADLAPRQHAGFRLTGAVPHRRVADLLAASDVLVLPSVDLPGHAEGTPTVILEAFAAGVPVVATRSGGIPNVVEHGETGLLVPQQDPIALADAIEALRAQPTLRRQLVAKGRERVRAQDWTLIARRITEFTLGRVTVAAR